MAENQLGYFAEEGWGEAKKLQRSALLVQALAWYRLAAGQGSVHGNNNLEAFCDELEERGDELCESASAPVEDAAIAQAERRARMSELRSRIDGLEGAAQDQEDQAYELEHLSKDKQGKDHTDAIGKIFNAMGSMGALKFHDQAAKDRDQAAPPGR